MENIKNLINQQKYSDAAALACYLGKTEKTRQLLAALEPNEEILEAYESLLLFDAPNDYDCYCRYLDFRQPNARNFYLDRRKYLKPLNDMITKMFIEDECDVMRIKMRTRSGKSENTIREAFWVQGNNPNGETLYCVGGGLLKDDVYKKAVSFIDEYWNRHCDIFPNSPGSSDIKMSKELTSIWLKKGEYADISIVTVGGSIEGFVQCTNFLILDDLVSSNEINSPKRLEDIYRSDILNAIMRRYISGKISIIGTPIPTLTNVQDPLDAFYDNRKLAGYKCFEYSLPSLNENLESNYAFRMWKDNTKFTWKFTTEELMKERKSAYESNDPTQISAFETVYQMKPMQRGERRFAYIKEFEELPQGRFREIVVLDPADKGADAAVCWYTRIYDIEPEIIYACDVFYDKRPMDIEKNGGFLDDFVEFLIKNNIHSLLYESNMGGTLLGETIKNLCKEKKWVFNYKDYRQTKNKVQRINDFSSETIKRVRVLKTPTSKSYKLAKEELVNWSEQSGHDDSPDCLTKIVEESITNKPKKVIFTSGI